MAKPDLNLFVIFDVIMQEQSVTAAADRLNMTQPSVSNAVSRMRHAWQDPLFIKHGRGIKPTPFADQLWRQISDPLRVISKANAPEEFQPATAKRQFRIALTDGMTSIFWLPLRKKIERLAPGIDIHAVPYKGDGEKLLLDADVDLVFDFFAGTSKLIHSEWMLDFQYVCVMRPDHPLARSPLTLDDFADADHLFVSLSGNAEGVVDKALAEQNRSRRIAMTVNSFASTFSLLMETNLITVLPYPIVADAVTNGHVVIRKTPVTLPPVKIMMAWHTRQNKEPCLHWLRDTLKEIMTEKNLQPITL
ncbi:MAG: LysR family transcriptional regulator [Sneathiella sp.]